MRVSAGCPACGSRPTASGLIAVSDRGTLWLAEPEHADDGTLIGFAGWRAVEPGALPGDPTGRDAEALAATDGRPGDRV